MSLSLIDRNDVVLRGRLAAPVELRELPSGDTLLSFTLTVRRPTPRPRAPRADTITCISFAPSLVARAPGWQVDDVIEVEGALQRRFWRGDSGVRVAHEVECRKARKVRTPARSSEADTA
ncbi:MAG: ssb [Klenkia sp.]|nr:ssb [Klenkia sp.]